MAETITCLFDKRERAEHCLMTLLGCGFTGRDINYITYLGTHLQEIVDERLPETAFTQLMRENILCGTECTVSIEGIGVVKIRGDMCHLFVYNTNHTLEQLSIGLLKAGISMDDSDYAMEGLRRGGVLLLIKAAPRLLERLDDILQIHRAANRDQRITSWQKSGWLKFDPRERAWTTAEIHRERVASHSQQSSQISFHPYESDFRSHFYISKDSSKNIFEDYADAYYYGYFIADDSRYRQKRWEACEHLIQIDWEKTHEMRWLFCKSMVAYGFLKSRQHYHPELLRRQEKSPIE